MLRPIFAAILAALMMIPVAGLAFGPLLDVQEVSSEDSLVIDIRAPDDYAAGHIPGAVNAPYGKWRGPPENPGRVPSVGSLQTMLRGLGATKNQNITVVHAGKNATDFGAAARVYWTLKTAGFKDLAILNGGYLAWAENGGQAATGAATPNPSDVTITLADTWMVDADGLRDIVDGKSDAVLIDARPLDFFQGKTKHGAAKQAGTIAGAMNLVHSTWFDKGSPLMEPPEAMITQIRAVAAENSGKPLVSFCNTGHWAATNWFAASEMAGIEGVKLYPESMVGWTLLGLDVVNGN